MEIKRKEVSISKKTKNKKKSSIKNKHFHVSKKNLSKVSVGHSPLKINFNRYMLLAQQDTLIDLEKHIPSENLSILISGLMRLLFVFLDLS
jgi:hypothetical protein